MSDVDITGCFRKEIRDALVSAFPSETKLKIMVDFQLDINFGAIDGGENLEELAYGLVKYCESQGKLDKLIRGARKENDGNNLLKEVEERFITIKLIQILQPLEDKYIKEIKEAYQACDFDDFNDWKEDLNTLNEILQNIKYLSDKNYKEKLSQFVANLLNIKSIPKINTKQKQLKEWGNKYGSNFDKLLTKNCSQNQINQEAISKIQPYLLVKLNMSEGYQNQYQVSSWLITDANNYDYEKNPDNCTPLKNILNEKESETNVFTLEDIPKLLESFLNQRIKYLKEYHVKPIVIFFLPRKLLNEEIEKILPNQDDDDLPIPIGSEYCLMFRSVERLGKRYRNRDNWLRKWKKYKDNSEEICSTSFICSNCERWQYLFSRLEEDNVFAVRLNQTPYDDIFKVIDRTAIPITVWLRKNEFESFASQTIRDNFDKLLKCKINKLPQEIKKLRSQAFGEIDPETDTQEHIGHHLAFLWEDPYLIPPQIEYTNT